MNTRQLVCVIGSMAALSAVILACSSDNTTSTPAPDAGSSGSSGGGDACKIANGSYTITSKADPAETATCKNSTVMTSYPPDGGADQPLPAGCVKTSEDKATCKTVIDCTIKTGTAPNAFTTTVHSETTIKNGLPEGSASSKTVKDSDMSVLAECKSNFTWTK